MKEVAVDTITTLVRDLFIDANVNLGEDVEAALHQALEKEESEIGKEVLAELIENARIAKTEGMPICQDTGLPVVFCELGQEVHLKGGVLLKRSMQGSDRGRRKAFCVPRSVTALAARIPATTPLLSSM